MKVDVIDAAKCECGKPIKLYTLTNDNNCIVQLSEIGAGIVGIIVPDRNGKMDDIVLGYPNLLDYFGDGPCAGKIPGRYANRIAYGKFSIDGKEYQLDLNTYKHHLHGGNNGFANKVWESHIDGESIIFNLISNDGDAGYPGELKVQAKYTWNNQDELKLELSATTTEPTIVNLTNHTYFNLKGEGNGNILDHYLKINARKWLETTDELIPTGKISRVWNTPMDFRSAKLIGKEINNDFDALKFGKGYDNCWVLKEKNDDRLIPAAELSCKESGRLLQIFTTQPGIQVYTGNWLKGCPQGKNNHEYNDYDGVALECQAFPDSPNNPNFPNTVLRCGEEYKQTIVFKFSTFADMKKTSLLGSLLNRKKLIP